jgi:hypothetical protein
MDVFTFSTPTLTPITPSGTSPTYASLCIAQTQLNVNAASVHSHGGDGLHGHLSLTILPTQYSTISNGIDFVLPTNPSVQPVHPVNATAGQITEINCRHKIDQDVFKTYHAILYQYKINCLGPKVSLIMTL